MLTNKLSKKTSPLSTNRVRLLIRPGRLILHNSFYPSPTLELPALSGMAVRELTGDILLPTARTLQSDFRFESPTSRAITLLVCFRCPLYEITCISTFRNNLECLTTQARHQILIVRVLKSLHRVIRRRSSDNLRELFRGHG